MTDDDEDLFPRASVLRKVLSFTFRLWRRTPLLAAACVAAMLLSTLTEVFVPLYAGRMIDAVGGGDAGAAWLAFGGIAVLGVAMVVFRHLGWWAMTCRLPGMRIVKDRCVPLHSSASEDVPGWQLPPEVAARAANRWSAERL